MSTPIAAVVYAAKSTVDERGSIKTQFADCRAMAEREDRQIVGWYEDENRSAYSASRGAGLKGACERAVEIARSGREVELWVQHSDRLARGDGVTADHLVEIFFAMRKAGVRLRSVQDDSNFDDA